MATTLLTAEEMLEETIRKVSSSPDSNISVRKVSW